MKIEIGESLIYSYLRHEKKCLITQTNWKVSGNWDIPQELQDNLIYEFDKINKHHAFSDIFKSDLDQTIKQAEIDVLGIDAGNNIYAFEIAFHENGLQYGSKIETRNRIFKKLLRAYVTLKSYFPNRKHIIAFCSPKVNPATEKHIKEYFEVLLNDFQDEGTEFHYYSNDKFNAKIVQKTIAKTIKESDSSELFMRSVKLLSIFDKNLINSLVQQGRQIQPPKISSNENLKSSAREKITLKGVDIPVTKDKNETVQEYVKKIMRLLLNNNLLPQEEINRLQDKEYCKKTFYLQFPLIRHVSKGYKDQKGHGRYWSRETFGGQFYVCNQWWKDHQETYLVKIRQWLLSLEENDKRI